MRRCDGRVSFYASDIAEYAAALLPRTEGAAFCPALRTVRFWQVARRCLLGPEASRKDSRLSDYLEASF
jgi:hypothetical protein